MLLRTRALAGLCLIALGILVAVPSAAATTYTVGANPYTATNAISVTDLWDSYELTAAAGSHVTYSVTASGGGCVMALFAKGHSVTAASSYYVLYSQESCVPSYSNTFPVASSDGTDFSVLVITTSLTAVDYTLTVNVQGPAVLDLALVGALVILAAVVIAGVAVLLLRRRKAAKVPPPVYAPPAYPSQPMPPVPPAEPPQQPPSPPGSWP